MDNPHGKIIVETEYSMIYDEEFILLCTYAKFYTQQFGIYCKLYIAVGLWQDITVL